MRSSLAWGVAVAVTVALAPAAPASAAPTTSPNAVLVWDIHAQTAIYDIGQQQPWVQGRSFAMVHGAIYDAVNAIAGTPYRPYLGAPPATGRESVDAAVGAAAHRVLVALLPDQRARLDSGYVDWLATIPAGAARRGGVRVGTRAADAMIAARRDDGAFGDQTWPIGTAPGAWRPTPPTNAADGAWLAHLKPFLVPWVQTPRTPGPPALSSARYARDVNEIQRVGSAASAARTADQTQAAIWWHDRRLVSWEYTRQLASTQRLDTLRTARMFAMLNLVGADAAIACFAAKAAWDFWRPITAVRLADTDGNPATVADPAWTPLLVTPPFPDYPSGHSCGTGAQTTTLTAVFGRDDIAFSAYSADAGARRHYRSFSQALAELIEARIWGGVHFRSASVDGAALGQAVARYGTTHHFQPTD